MQLFIPVSLGELLDKISILKIKTEKILDKEKLKNIYYELGLLEDISNKYLLESKLMQKLFDELYQINIKLWNIEDDIRIKEKDKMFDDSFISLARSVYNFNDERARLKRLINQESNSSIIEEKSYASY